MSDITTDPAKFGDSDNTLLLKLATAEQALASDGGGGGGVSTIEIGLNVSENAMGFINLTEAPVLDVTFEEAGTNDELFYYVEPGPVGALVLHKHPSQLKWIWLDLHESAGSMTFNFGGDNYAGLALYMVEGEMTTFTGPANGALHFTDWPNLTTIAIATSTSAHIGCDGCPEVTTVNYGATPRADQIVIPNAKLTQAAVDLAFAKGAVAGGVGNFWTMGGDSPKPTVSGGSTHATINVVTPDASALPASGDGAWVKFGTETFWFNVDAANDDPGQSNEHEVALVASDTAASIATALRAVMDANGYTCYSYDVSNDAYPNTGGLSVAITATGNVAAATQSADNAFVFNSQNYNADVYAVVIKQTADSVRTN